MLCDESLSVKGYICSISVLGYGYWLEVNELAFLCPLNGDEEHPFEGREGNLRVIAPSEFSTDLFEERVLSLFVRNI